VEACAQQARRVHVRDGNNKVGRQAPIRDRGQSLIEVVITIAVISIVLVPLMSAVIQNIRTSSSQRNSSLVEIVMQNAADRVNRATKGCGGYAQFVEAAAQSQGWAPDRATVTQWYFVPGADPTKQGRWEPGVCAPGVTNPDELLVQRIDITVVGPDGQNRKSIQVVKSNV
jgi:prepilin-type N-terminal cleavage/methylation domain-containing protein